MQLIVQQLFNQHPILERIQDTLKNVINSITLLLFLIPLNEAEKSPAKVMMKSYIDL